MGARMHLGGNGRRNVTLLSCGDGSKPPNMARILAEGRVSVNFMKNHYTGLLVHESTLTHRVRVGNNYLGSAAVIVCRHTAGEFGHRTYGMMLCATPL